MTAEPGQGDGSAEASAPSVTPAPAPTLVARRTGRRVTTEPVPGTDPNPTPEPPRSTGTENDQRLKADKPPHWG